MSNDDFETVLEYINGMKGNSRQITVQEAEKLLTECEKENDEKDEDEETKIAGNITNYYTHHLYLVSLPTRLGEQ